MLRVFVDTNIFPINDLPDFIGDKKIEYFFSSVTKRELAGTDLLKLLEERNKVLETAVWDESFWGEAVWGADDDHLEEIIKIISNGSFPPVGKRNSLLPGEVRQLRDAMIIETAIRDKFDYFISNDKRAFIGNEEKRKKLSDKFGIKIVLRIEFLSLTQKLHE